MARLCSNENIPIQVVQELRSLGHDVLTSLDAGNANRGVPDEEVLTFSAKENRVLLTMNRLHFLRLHQTGRVPHAGIILLTFDLDFRGQALRIHEAITRTGSSQRQLVRINRPAKSKDLR